MSREHFPRFSVFMLRITGVLRRNDKLVKCPQPTRRGAGIHLLLFLKSQIRNSTAIIVLYLSFTSLAIILGLFFQPLQARLFIFLHHRFHRLVGALFLLNQKEKFTVWLFGVTNPVICPFHPRHDISLVVNFFNDKNSAACGDGII